MTDPARTVQTAARSYTIPHPVIDTDTEATRSHRVRVSLDYVDTWDEMTPTQRGELIAGALDALRERNRGGGSCD